MVRIKGKEELQKFYKKKYPNKDPHVKNPQGIQNPEGLKNNLSNLISNQFGTLLNSYTKAYNKHYDRKGSLFRNTFKRKPVTDSTYYTRLIRYIHLNPVKHGFVDQPQDWEHSSYRSLLSKYETLLKRRKVLGWFGGRKEFM